MSEKLFVTPEYVTANDIKRVRKKLGLTQKEFAALVNSSKPTIERWERNNGKITGPIVLLLKIIEDDSYDINKLRIPEKRAPIRLWYMHRQKVCTIIDVDETRRRVKIINYTDNLLFRAFGVEEHPNYDRYLEFLESRCFPKTQDKMKLILKDLDIPFYDPFMIIEKTEGRMAEDDFWIRIER